MNLSLACVSYVYKNSTIETMANSTARWEPGPLWSQSTVAFLCLQGWTEQNTSPGSLAAQNVFCSETLFQVKVLKIGLHCYSRVLSRGWVLVFRTSFLLAPWKMCAWGGGLLDNTDLISSYWFYIHTCLGPTSTHVPFHYWTARFPYPWASLPAHCHWKSSQEQLAVRPDHNQNAMSSWNCPCQINQSSAF